MLINDTQDQTARALEAPSTTAETREHTRARLRTADVSDVTAEDWDRCIELLRIAFNGGPSWFSATADPHDHLQWKLVDFPGAARAYFSDEGASLRGFLATLSRRWLVRGEPRTATDLVDAALHPTLQNRVLMEIFRSLRREIPRWKGADFGLSFASHPALLRNRGFQGKHDLGSTLEAYVRPLDLVRFVFGERSPSANTGPSRTRIQIEAQRRRSAKPAIARLAVWQARVLRQRMRQPRLALERQSPFDIQTYEAFDERIDTFFERAATAFDLIQVRDQTFLNWRYADRRAGPFTVRVAVADGEILGYLALRTGRATADIADLLVLPGRLDVAHALIRDAVELARSDGASGIRSWIMQGHPYQPLLNDLGFVRIRTSTKPVVHANPQTDEEELAFLMDPNTRIHLMLGDSDHV